MKISTKGRYGLRAMLDLACHPGPGPLSLGEIARMEDLSYSYLESLFAALKRAGLVTGSAGASGGYRLTRPPEEITARMVLEPLEKDLSITDRDPAAPESSLRAFLETEVWDPVDEGVLGVLETTTRPGHKKAAAVSMGSSRAYTGSRSSIGRGFSPLPISTVNPGRRKVWMYQSLRPPWEASPAFSTSR